MDTMVSEGGANLSCGQRQRLLITRCHRSQALLRKGVSLSPCIHRREIRDNVFLKSCRRQSRNYYSTSAAATGPRWIGCSR